MDVLDEIHVGMIEISWGDFIGVAVVVSTELDDDKIGGLLRGVVENLRFFRVEGTGSATGV